MIKANLGLIRNIVIVLLSVACVNGADVITLAIEHHINDVHVDEGQYIDGDLYVWVPNSGIDEPEVFSFEGDTEITLELEEPGMYFFTAETTLYDADGSVVTSSEESDSVDYEVKEPTDITDLPDADNPGADLPDADSPDDESSAKVVGAGVGGSPFGCFITSLSIQ